MAVQPSEYRTETASTGYGADLTGYSVAAVDGDIGYVDKATNELLGSSYLVVDTGPWIFGRKVCAGRCSRADRHRREEGLRRPDQAPDQGRARVRRLVLSRRIRSCGFMCGPALASRGGCRD